jgi:hypothetical protein
VIDVRAYGLELIGAVADGERGQNGAILSPPRRNESGSRHGDRGLPKHQCSVSPLTTQRDRERKRSHRRPRPSRWTRSRPCASPSSASIVATKPGKPRIHVQSRRYPTRPPCWSTSRENDTGWVRRRVRSFSDVQAAVQTAHPTCGPRRRPVLPQIAVPRLRYTSPGARLTLLWRCVRQMSSSRLPSASGAC